MDIYSHSQEERSIGQASNAAHIGKVLIVLSPKSLHAKVLC